MKPPTIVRRVLYFFDKLEDHIREALSKHPIPYSIIGGVSVVLFWRAIWETADIIYHAPEPGFWSMFFYPPTQVLIATSALMMTGLIVSVFIGDRILLSGLRHEKKLEETTKELVKEEVVTMSHLHNDLRELRKEIENLKAVVAKTEPKKS